MIVRVHGISHKFHPNGDAVSFECDFVDIVTDTDTYSESMIVSQDGEKLNIEYKTESATNNGFCRRFPFFQNKSCQF